MVLIDYGILSRLAFPALLAVRLVRRATLLPRRLENRRQLFRLAQMTDRELADIGLRRGDLHEAWRRRGDIDPTLHLERIARRQDASQPDRPPV